MEKRPFKNSNLIFLVIIIVLFAMYSFFNSDRTADISPSTIERTPLPADAEITDYDTIEGDWIVDLQYNEASMADFYKRTGVAPYLYVLSSDNSMTLSEIIEFADTFYEEKLKDSNRFLVVFRDNGAPEYDLVLKLGTEAASFMDEEAQTIFREYVDFYFAKGQTPYYLVFADSFDQTCDRILNVRTVSSRTIAVIILIAIIAAGIAFKILYDKRIIFKNRKSTIHYNR